MVSATTYCIPVGYLSHKLLWSTSSLDYVFSKGTNDLGNICATLDRKPAALRQAYTNTTLLPKTICEGAARPSDLVPSLGHLRSTLKTHAAVIDTPFQTVAACLAAVTAVAETRCIGAVDKESGHATFATLLLYSSLLALGAHRVALRWSPYTQGMPLDEVPIVVCLSRNRDTSSFRRQSSSTKPPVKFACSSLGHLDSSATDPRLVSFYCYLCFYLCLRSKGVDSYIPELPCHCSALRLPRCTDTLRDICFSSGCRRRMQCAPLPTLDGVRHLCVLRLLLFSVQQR